MKINSEQEMLDFGYKFADYVTGRVTTLEGVPQKCRHFWGRKSRQDPSGALIIELVGDVGTGKTTFTRGFAEGLGIKEPITSPSFTISKSYALPDNKQLIHYDFYRLSDPGLMSEDLQENLNNPNNIIIIEWGNTINNLLPNDRTIIKIKYDETGGRNLFFQ